MMGQVKDQLIYNGIEYEILDEFYRFENNFWQTMKERISSRTEMDCYFKNYITFPLDPYLEKHNLKFQATSTANWRGYVGYWEIIDNKMHLVRISRTEFLGGNQARTIDIDLATILPDYQGKPYFCDWINGKMYCTKQIKPCSLLVYLTGECDLFILENGIVQSVTTFISEKFQSRLRNHAK